MLIDTAGRALGAAEPCRFGRKEAQPSTDLLVKASHFELEIKADGEPGEIRGYGSVWDKIDSYGEVVVKGAFTKSLKAWAKSKRPIPMLWQHRSDVPIGVWDTAAEDDKGLALEGRLNLETQRGKEAWSDIKMQSVGGLSIGYYEVKADPWDFGAVEPRKLIELDLREVSPVTFPALKEAQIDAVKARLARGERLTIREFEGLLREKLRLSRSDAEEIAALGYKAWLQRDVGPAATDAAGLHALSATMASFSLPQL
jgi:Escherichia/Staphylococcus phage prohead protease